MTVACPEVLSRQASETAKDRLNRSPHDNVEGSE